VTDANIVLGFMNPGLIAGGTLRVRRQAAVDAIQEHLVPHLHLDVRDIAHGIREVANAAMLRSIRAVTSEKGRDPRQYAMVAFGGSGPVHAASLAEMAGITKVYVPPLPGLFSSVGLLLADMRYDYVRALSGRGEPEPLGDEIGEAFRALVDEARAQAVSSGIGDRVLSFQYFVDVRYAGQSYETAIEVTPPLRGSGIVQRIRELFHAEHERRFGYRHERETVTVTVARLRSWSTARATSLGDIGRSSVAPPTEAEGSVRQTYFGPKQGELAAPIIGRHRLSAVPRHGPVIVEEASTTVVVPPGWQATADTHGNIVLEMDV
jgi:N-methylhydantoinase A